MKTAIITIKYNHSTIALIIISIPGGNVHRNGEPGLSKKSCLAKSLPTSGAENEAATILGPPSNGGILVPSVSLAATDNVTFPKLQWLLRYVFLVSIFLFLFQHSQSGSKGPIHEWIPKDSSPSGLNIHTHTHTHTHDQ